MTLQLQRLLLEYWFNTEILRIN